MLAFLTRRQDTTADLAETPTRPAADNVVMQFRTQGGATIDLLRITWSIQWHRDDPRRDYSGFQWICRGCETGGRDHRLGWGYEEIQPDDSRQAANQHAAQCHAMPKPTV